MAKLIHMLNQANGDRQILAKQLNISPHQISYVTHSGEGEGRLFFGNVILPFVDHFPKDLELYRILTTRLSAVMVCSKSYRGRYAFPALAAASYPFVDLPSGDTLRCKLFPADKFYKISLYFDGRIKYNEVND